MCLHRFILPLLLSPLTLVSSASPSRALRSDVLYTSHREFVQVSPMRPLTANAHVSEFAYEPLGIEIAYVGAETSGDTATNFVKVVDVRSGHEMEHLSMTTPADDRFARFHLLGWSRDGRYLTVERTSSATANAGEMPKMQTDILRWDVGAAPPVTTLVPLTSLLPEGAVPSFSLSEPSPGGRWIKFTQFYEVQAPGRQPVSGTLYSLYDSERNTLRPLALPEGEQIRYWADEGHLRLSQRAPQGTASQVYEASTGKILDAPKPAPQAVKAAASRHYLDLTLDVEHRLQPDLQGSGGQIDSHILWIRRTPKTKQPLGVTAAGLTPGEEDPQAVWSPSGKQIAFLAHGDLCVTDLATNPEPGPQERLAVGLTLPCAEERQLAERNLKQIGLALTQYAQDFDEHYPPTEGLNDAIYPYLKTRDVFQIGSHRFVYQLPGGTSLAKIESPAETVQGTMDMPCARVVLFADGHVKSFPKPGVLPEGAK